MYCLIDCGFLLLSGQQAFRPKVDPVCSRVWEAINYDIVLHHRTADYSAKAGLDAS